MAAFGALEFADDADELGEFLAAFKVLLKFLECYAGDDFVLLRGDGGSAHAAFEDDGLAVVFQFDAKTVFHADFGGLSVLAGKGDAHSAGAEIVDSGFYFSGCGGLRVEIVARGQSPDAEGDVSIARNLNAVVAALLRGFDFVGKIEQQGVHDQVVVHFPVGLETADRGGEHYFQNAAAKGDGTGCLIADQFLVQGCFAGGRLDENSAVEIADEAGLVISRHTG